MLISFCGDEEGLRAGIVVVADLGEDLVRLPAGALAVARHARGGDGRLAVDQRRLGPAIARLRDVVQLGMDLDVAGRDGAFAIGEEIDRPVVLRDAVLLARGAAAEKRLLGAVPLRHAGRKGAFGVFAEQVVDGDDAGVIVRVEVDAENARQEDAVSHLQPAQLHVADQFVDDGLTADTRLLDSRWHTIPLIRTRNEILDEKRSRALPRGAVSH